MLSGRPVCMCDTQASENTPTHTPLILVESSTKEWGGVGGWCQRNWRIKLRQWHVVRKRLEGGSWLFWIHHDTYPQRWHLQQVQNEYYLESVQEKTPKNKLRYCILWTIHQHLKKRQSNTKEFYMPSLRRGLIIILSIFFICNYFKVIYNCWFWSSRGGGGVVFFQC